MFDKTEDEQIQIVKEWFRKYWLWLLALIVVMGGSTFGWYYKEEGQQEEFRKASAVYSDIENYAFAIENETDKDKRDELIEQLSASSSTIGLLFPDNIYADLGRQIHASTLAGLGMLEQAAVELEVLRTSKDLFIQNNSIIALAKVRWQQGHSEQAMQLLADVSSGFESVAHELQGDIKLSEDKPEEAATFYQKALDSSESPNRLLRIKHNHATQ